MAGLIENLASRKLQRILLSNIEANWAPPLQEIVLTISEKNSNIRNEHQGERLVCKWTEPNESWMEAT
ncbi:MAG: hypothetical protein DMG80_12580 [Acidobacteria bacterium]|nr:MAG: hypothetical protein DMG80_12580 [Acidobacteriota bacterium]